jgi:orotidine-5'-phosphate decarboxylase
MPLLIPGVGAQGGSLERAVEDGTASFEKVAVINVSRSVLYASSDDDFAQKAREQLESLNGIVNGLRSGTEAVVVEGEAAAPEQAENNSPPAEPS